MKGISDMTELSEFRTILPETACEASQECGAERRCLCRFTAFHIDIGNICLELHQEIIVAGRLPAALESVPLPLSALHLANLLFETRYFPARL